MSRATSPDAHRILTTTVGSYPPDRVRYVHPDWGFWMLKRSVADRKIDALVQGRNLYCG